MTSLFLVISAATSSGAAMEPRAAVYCGPGKLDLACAPVRTEAASKRPYVGFQPLSPRYAGEAYVVRFGEGERRDTEPAFLVQLGSYARQVLFWAAVATVLL